MQKRTQITQNAQIHTKKDKKCCHCELDSQSPPKYGAVIRRLRVKLAMTIVVLFCVFCVICVQKKHYICIMNNIFLIGYMGSGKTTIGRIIAPRLNMSFIDLDVFIEQRYFKSIAQIFEEKGEDEFRKIEHNTLLEVSCFENTVVSTGGGAPCFFDNIDVMNDRGLTVYLQLSPEKLLHNLKKGKAKRPLIKNKTDEELLRFITENLEKRKVFYEQAKLILNPEEDVEKIIEKIENYKIISL